MPLVMGGKSTDIYITQINQKNPDATIVPVIACMICHDTVMVEVMYRHGATFAPE